jgi:hypothetical protein
MDTNCEQCNKDLSDGKEINFTIEKSDGFRAEDAAYDECLRLCLNCFNNSFSVARFSKLGMNAREKCCCACHNKINQKKESHTFIICVSDKINLYILYCEKCFNKDVGI